MCKDKQMIKQFNEIWVLCETQSHQHRLAYHYYSYRQYRYNVFPMTLLTMSSGITAFLATSSIIPTKAKEILALTVGILSVISGGIQSINQDAKFDSKAEMHRNAARGMVKILDKIEFLQNDLTINIQKVTLSAMSNGGNTKNKTDEKEGDESNTHYVASVNGEISDQESITKLANICVRLQDVYEQCMDSCQSQIPDPIAQAFSMAQARLELILTTEDRKCLQKEYGDLGKRKIERCLYNELFCEIYESVFFPFQLPKPERVVTQSVEKVVQQFRGKKDMRFERVC